VDVVVGRDPARNQTGPVSRAFRNGRGWDRTSDLPRVKRALSR
jgi:hypothetical protein